MKRKIEDSEIRVLRIMHRMNVGGPMYHAAVLTKYLPPPYTTKLICGAISPGEADGTYVLRDYKIEPLVIKEMGRSLKNPFKDLMALYKIIRVIRKYRPHIVHTHAAKAGTLGRLAAFLTRVPIILHTFHGHVFHSYFSKFVTRIFIQIERILSRLTKRIIVISSIQKHEIVNIYKICSENKVNVIPLGFELDKFFENSDEKRKKIRAEFNLSENEILIGIVGRIEKIKNHRFFISVVATVKKKTEIPIKAIIVGDGPLRKEIEEYAEYLGVRENVIFASWRQDTDCLFAAFDIVALTSDNEGTPVSIIEAQAAGKPVVCTNVGGVRDIVLENETGFISEKGDLHDFSNNMIRLIENPELKKEMAAKMLHVRERFSYRRLVNDIILLYDELIKKK